jgi:hypothetical protein
MAETKVVAPDTANLRTIAQIYQDQAKTLRVLKAELDVAWVTPGSTETAGLLQTAFNNVKTSYQTFLDTLMYGTDQLGRQLVKVADRYDSAENLNADDAGRLAELIDSLKTKFPGINGVIPPST